MMPMARSAVSLPVLSNGPLRLTPTDLGERVRPTRGRSPFGTAGVGRLLALDGALLQAAARGRGARGPVRRPPNAGPGDGSRGGPGEAGDGRTVPRLPGVPVVEPRRRLVGVCPDVTDHRDRRGHRTRP